MTRFRMIITDFISDDLAPERKVVGDIADVVALNATTEAEAMPQLHHADVVVGYHYMKFSPKLIDAMPRCKLVVRGGVGTDNVDIQYARSKGIPVANVPDYGTEEVADSALAHMLALTRGLGIYNLRMKRKQGPWNHSPAAPLFRLRGRVLGILGLGRIGIAMALRGKALGMDVVFHDPFIVDGIDKALGIRKVETLPQLLKQSYVLSIHCPLTPDTHNLIDEKAFAQMPRGSYLVNTGRGSVVKNECIPEMIRSGHLAGAGIDVFEHEPPANDHPLVQAWRDVNDPCYDRVIITPHAAFYSQEGLLDIRVKSAQNCRRALLGEPLRNVVN